ncbi:MAG: YfcC family protein, partial [Peptococcaceae bacterium]|nr:YfcC family protein [Peptococcaceae bacterium]
MPSAYTILFGIILIMMLLTWVVPAGQYEYIQNGDVSQPIAGTYHRVAANQQSIFDVILASFHGFYEAVEISLFILMVGGFLGVVMETGAINAGIARVIQKLSGREKYMIPILMILFGLGGTSFGMWEETMAFYPLLLPVFIAAGYDSITAVSVIMLGAGVGTLCSTVNPFATGIASGFAGISLGDGLLLRLLMLLVLEAVAITFVMRYATKVYTN